MTFDALGLDSLGRLGVLEALQTQHPEIKLHTQWMNTLHSPTEMIALLEKKASAKAPEATLETSLFQLLHKFSGANDSEIAHETPFAHYLTDGFTRGAVWENLASDYDVCHFAGEALMSRRNAGEALALLNRLG